MNLVERALAPTPKWFKILRTVGIALASVGGIIIASPVALPVGLVSAAGYLVLGGSIISVVSQTAVKSEEEAKTKPLKTVKTTLEAPFLELFLFIAVNKWQLLCFSSVLFKWCNHIALMRWFAWE
jgi:hypothetical protein